MVTMVITTIIGLASKTIISRVTGPEGVGIYSLVILVPSLAFAFGSLGLNTSAIYLVGRKQFDIRQTVGTVLSTALGLSLLLVVVIAAWAVISYESLFQQAEVVFAVLAIAAIPGFYLLNNAMAVLQGKNLIWLYNVIGIASVSLSLLLLGVFLLIFNFGALGAVLAWFVTTWFNAGLALYFVARFSKISFQFSKYVFRSQLVYGIKAYFANLAGFLVRRVDVLIVANYLGTTQLGYYSVAFMLGELIWYLASSISTALIPFIAASEPTDSSRVTAAAVRVTLWCTAILCLCVPLGDRFAIRILLGEAFLPAVVPLRWLLPGILFGAVEKVLAGDLAGRGRPGVMTVSAFLALAVNVGANIWLIPRFGISGASLASSMAYGSAAVLTAYRFCRITGSSWRELLLLRKSDIDYLIRVLRAPFTSLRGASSL